MFSIHRFRPVNRKIGVCLCYRLRFLLGDRPRDTVESGTVESPGVGGVDAPVGPIPLRPKNRTEFILSVSVSKIVSIISGLNYEMYDQGAKMKWSPDVLQTTTHKYFLCSGSDWPLTNCLLINSCRSSGELYG